MKGFISIGFVLVIGVFGIFYLTDYYKINKEAYEVRAFQNLLNEEFFPVLNDAFAHMDQAADELEEKTFIDWYLQAGGRDENAELQEKIEETRNTVLEEEVKGTTSVPLKKNILEQIAALEETLMLLSTAAETDEDPYSLIHEQFTYKIDELYSLSEQMDLLLDENNSIKEKTGSI
ncbi:hypothetical protein [Lysinibacillus sp. SGAir0095]|uniref:hypothetical protein n=1 Tax=Lysinibacillus sp. SGAir0095 TaxID=2070463 RepID=UPI0010CD2F38|nr:hypothetical protein [Lysinibacillus sp. SGAir0095]QCR32716.1 hypothetical protein C1N55_11260 [Lysinibacillus sp. SGAir0095]